MTSPEISSPYTIRTGLWGRAADRLGRRGALLTTLGITYVLVGLGAFVIEPTTTSTYLTIPSYGRALLWAITGLVAFVFAWRLSDRRGWVALFIPPIIRGGAYTMDWLKGAEDAWYQAVAGNVPFIAVVLICAGWREYRRRDAVPNPEV